MIGRYWLFLSWLVGACVATPVESDEPEARASGVVVTSSALAVGTITALNGTYGAGCTNRSGGWSVRVSGAEALASGALSVVQADTACTLTLTEIVADATYSLTPSIPLGSSYRASASSFATSTRMAYANAKLSATSFDGDFVITLLYANDPPTAAGAFTAALASTPTVVASSFASINDNLIVIGKPTGTAQGDLMLAAVASESNKTASLAGWTSLGHASNAIGLDLLYKVAGSSEPSSYTFAMSGSTKSAGGILTVRGAGASPIDVTGSAASSWTASSITTTTGSTLLVGCWGNIASASTPPGTMTERWDTAFSDKIALACSTEARATAGATGTRTATAGGSNTNPLSRLVAIKP